MITLKNTALSVNISELGAEIISITVDGKERLWDGDPAFWSGTAPRFIPHLRRFAE